MSKRNYLGRHIIFSTYDREQYLIKKYKITNVKRRK